MKYAVSDIHGQLGKYKQLLELVKPGGDTTLYILGDVMDHGPSSVEILHDLSRRCGIVPIIGNHDLIALTSMREIMRGESGTEFQREWLNIGGKPSYDSFMAAGYDERRQIIAELEAFVPYIETEAGGRKYLLLHASLEHFSPERPLTDYAVEELIYHRPDYKRVYFPDVYIVSGHRPSCSADPSYLHRIWKGNNHILIDCDADADGALGVLCLDTLEENYIV